MSLSPDDFDAFHEAVHGAGKRAFDWQNRLLRKVVSQRKWPRVLDLPTGGGKTTCIDIALFALALDAQNELAARWCPRRIVMVVDRRIIVDQVAERGRKLLLTLMDPKATRVVREVARLLRKLSQRAAEPIRVFTLRGGMPKDDGWARSPDQPLILASTVDQVGSRLLIQGFGVSPEMRPVHAGLLGNDVLLLLDEVHISQPFAQTLDALAKLRQRFDASSGLAPRFDHVFLSATVGASRTPPFRLIARDKARTSTLGKRLHAAKPVSIIEVDDRLTLQKACISEVRRLIAHHSVIAVVVNRIASVSAIVRQLRELCDASIEIVPLTGRMRPLDRDEVLRGLRPRLATNRERSADMSKLIVVATQCIEAGADFDFDAIVSEAASLDALRQRLGRLDRSGDYEHAEGVVIWDRAVTDDPVYGGAITATMKWLKKRLCVKRRVVDFGILALPLPPDEELLPMLTPRRSAPILLPAYLDLWMQTSPAPQRLPDVTLWLHGNEGVRADVQIVWRADLNETDLARSADAPAGTPARDWPALLVGAAPPSSLEAVSLPLGAARRWLCGNIIGEVADVEGIAEKDRDPTLTSWVLRWAGSHSEVVRANVIQPGDTIVIPTTRGGLADGCFDPSATHVVLDLAEQASLLSKGQPVLRLSPPILSQWDLNVSHDDHSAAREALARLAEQQPPASWRALWLREVARASSLIPVDPDRHWYVLRGKRVSAESIRALLSNGYAAEDGIDFTTDQDESPHIGQPVPLATHSENVERFARAYARGVLPDTLVRDLALAGWLHDIGKADRRCQIMFRKGSEISYLKDETPWAKSGMSPRDSVAHRRAQQSSGYPRGARHEVQSLVMLEQQIDVLGAKAHDVDLVLHLTSSHHGYCRPLAPIVQDPAPVEVALGHHRSAKFGVMAFPATSSKHELHRLDASLAKRFWRLTQKYGWLELCWLEAILRLADHSASEMEQKTEETRS